MPAPVVAAFQYQYVLVGRFSDAQMQKGRERKEQSTEWETGHGLCGDDEGVGTAGLGGLTEHPPSEQNMQNDSSLMDT
jgi:hypothetical protein